MNDNFLDELGELVTKHKLGGVFITSITVDGDKTKVNTGGAMDNNCSQGDLVLGFIEKLTDIVDDELQGIIQNSMCANTKPI